MTCRLAFLDDVHPSIKAIVEAQLPVGWQVSFTASKADADRHAAAARAGLAFIIGSSVDAALLQAAPELKFIQKLGSGTDKIDRAACVERGVTVARLQAGNAAQVAEHTVMMMLAALRRLPYFDRTTRSGAWLKEEGRGTQRQLAGKKVGLIGLGAIGREVAKRLSGFDVRLSYYDPVPAPAAVEQQLSIERRELDELIAASDVISLHLPLQAQTRHLLNARRLGLMKSGTTVVNCARGGLVSEAALCDALERGHLFAAALDTFEHEPPVGSPLLTRPDVVVSPHLAGATLENFAVAFRRGLQNAESFLAGRALPDGELVSGPAHQ
jgi:phosphoglycerate dehydrogenase-like enzyme